MPETKWDQGPWTISESDPSYLDIASVSGKRVASFCTALNVSGDRATAYLIAAAPELYEALERACACIRYDFETRCITPGEPLNEIPEPWKHQLEKWESALAHARGEK
jgi:hypothetical protein